MKITPQTFDARNQAWSPLAQVGPSIADEARHWVYLPGSLTQALRDRASHFNVDVIEESWVTDDAAHCGFENQPEPMAFFSRKVLLCNGDTPWVAAHTFIPQSSLENGLSALTNLHNKPLGELLFASDDVRKDNLEACLTPFGWGRRTRYFLHNQPLVVSEYFLSDLIEYEQNRT